jgi:glutathione synthase/RimK-type ligase-like ATP-grasp enzyme
MDQTVARAILPVGLSDKLNAGCFCMTLDRSMLLQHLKIDSGHEKMWGELQLTHPHLFASTPTFVSEHNLLSMLDTVQAVERISGLQAYREQVLSAAPEIARQDVGPLGVFMGYDFHLTPGGPKLIEINTNAGGAFLNAALLNAQRACCKEVNDHFLLPVGEGFETVIAAMFRNEWRLQGRTAPLRTICIVDNAPEQQYLYPEFVLAKAMLERQGFDVHICDPSELTFSEGALWAGDRSIDLVYNRLVDFTFDKPEHDVLRRAYAEGAVVVTPGPHHHALLANKGNLIILSDPEALRHMGADGTDIAALITVPRAQAVTPENAPQLWIERKQLFFKPLGGYGGKAVYRGDKVTKSTWAVIAKGGYIAQQLVTPGERIVKMGDAHESRKMDIRLYTYDGKLLIAAARIYQGQTTNFRTPGGGFAPVFIV